MTRSRRAAFLIALAAFFTAAPGCTKTKTETKPLEPAASAKRQPPKPAVPDEVMTQAARLFGAPFEREVHMKITMTRDGETTEYFVYRKNDLAVANGTATVTSKLVNAPQGLDAGESYELRKDGVYAISVGASHFDPPALAMPATIEKGKTWSYTTKALEMTMNAAAKVAGIETVKVPLGEFKAWRIETTITLRGQAGTTAKVEDVSYYVEGIGVVKSETHSTAPNNDGNRTTTKILMEAIPEP
jgi:hypothetical protein